MSSGRFSCLLCLDLLKDPVTLPCGHNYCLHCIQRHWDAEESQEGYRCPQCRKRSRDRPVLQKNILLAQLVEKQKRMGLNAAPGASAKPGGSTGLGGFAGAGGSAVPGELAGPGDVACDFCTGRKQKAIKTCLVCQVSYCREHLKPHHLNAAFKTHQLVEPCKDLRNVCSTHREVKKMFCRTDQQSICHRCTMDQHRDHDIVPAAAERAKKQKDVEDGIKVIPDRIKEGEEKVKLLRKQQDDINRSADEAVELSQNVFNQLIHLLQDRSDQVTQHLRNQQEQAVSGFRELQEKLEQEVTQLKWIHVQLEQLVNIEDHNQFLYDYSSLAALYPSKTSAVITTPPINDFDSVTAAVLARAEKVQDVLGVTWTSIPAPAQPEPKTKAEFMRYSIDLTLDPNTVSTLLALTEVNRKVTRNYKMKNHPYHPDRFTGYCPQVLSRESLTGRCYWQVKWKSGKEGIGDVSLAVAYKSISRDGSDDSDKCNFGFNDQSWVLKCSKYDCEFIHNNIKTKVPSPQSSTIGVFLDHSAGILSFYSVSTSMILLHRVQTTFTEPLLAGIRCNFAIAEIVSVY